MSRLTRTEFHILKACDKCIELNECHQKYCVRVSDALSKLKHYEDLETQLQEVYGECDGLLEESIKCLVEHEEVDVGNPVKARLLTDDSVDMWEEYKKIGTVEECRFYKAISEKDLSASGLDLKAIKELREYREIGTVEEFREAMEKQREKKPINLEYVRDDYSWMGECPFCGAYVSENKKYCLMCGQHLDWSKP